MVVNCVFDVGAAGCVHVDPKIRAKLGALAAGSTKEALREHVAEAKAVADGKVCPYCGSELVERRRKSDGGMFIGCSAFPKCRYTRKQW